MRICSLLYADEMKLYAEIEVIEDCYAVQRNLDRLCAWCDVNKLYLNVRKCKVITFSRAKVQVTYEYSLNGQNLERVSVIRDLGVLMDSKLTFSEHVDVTVSNARQMLWFIMRVGRDFRDPYALKSLYVSLVRSKLEYASCVWMPYQNGCIARLESVQEQFILYEYESVAAV
jgi:ribonucleases P/MRP protein subunit RPP40